MTLKLIKLNAIVRRRGGTPDWKDDDYGVLSNDRNVGRIYRADEGITGEKCHWSCVGGMGSPPGDVRQSGLANSLEEAMICVRENFERWLNYAGLQEKLNAP